jgi:hypothetical protein
MVASTPAATREEATVHLDLDEFWPDSASLVGMQFETPEDFARAQALLAEHLDIYRWVWADSLTIGVLRADAHLVDAAGLTYTEVEVQDDNEPLTAEENEEYRKWQRESFRQFVEHLRREG